jgi:predicted lipid-binding transport protein (Tim44 family)
MTALPNRGKDLAAEVAAPWSVYSDPRTKPRERLKAAKAAADAAIRAFEAGERDEQRLAAYVEMVAAGILP